MFLFIREPVRGGAEDEVMEAGVYTGRFSWPALKRTLRIRSALLVYLMDACQGSTWWAFSFWAPAYLAPGVVLGEMGENGDWRYLVFPVAAIGLIVVIWGLWQTIRRRHDA